MVQDAGWGYGVGMSIKQAGLAESKIVVPGNRGIKVVKSVTIRRSAQELYEFWRDLSNLQKVIKHPVSITSVSAIESHWEFSAPGKDPVAWDAVIINDEPGQLIAWRSREGAEVPNAGSVRFERAPGEEGTEVTVKLEYDPPGGKLGALVAKFTGDAAGTQVADALRRMKALFEAGEIPTTEGQPVGSPQREKAGQKKERT
jgi:uncharacterized membrane protein